MKSWIYVHVSLLSFCFILFLQLCVRLAFFSFILYKIKNLLIRFRFASFWSKAIWIGWSAFNYGLIEVNLKTIHSPHRGGERDREKVTHRERERERLSGRAGGCSKHMWTIWGYLNCSHVFVAVAVFFLFCHLFLILDHTPLPLRNERNFIKSSVVASKLFHYSIYSSLCCIAEIRLVIIFYSILFYSIFELWSCQNVCECMSASVCCVWAWIYFSWLIEWLNKITIYVYAWVFWLRMLVPMPPYVPMCVSLFVSECVSDDWNNNNSVYLRVQN